MKKRPTRKKLLEALDQIAAYSKFRPVMTFIVYFTDENGAMLWDDKVELETLDEIVSLLMDKSIFYRVVKVSSADFLFEKRIYVSFTLSPDREYRTNIDADFMERIMELEVKPDESWC